MAKNLKELLTQPLPRKDNGQAMLFGFGGGYMIYLAYDMLRAAYAGEFAVSMKVAWITSGLMLLAGLFIVSYAVRLWFAHKRATEEENARLLAERLAREAAEAEEAREAVWEEESWEEEELEELTEQ